MKISSKKTMLTAAVLVTLSSGSAFAATPGTVDSQDLFRANRLVTDHVNPPAVRPSARMLLFVQLVQHLQRVLRR